MARKPRVALAAWELGRPQGPIGLLTQIISRGHDRYDFTVVSRGLYRDVRPLVDWRRVHLPRMPFRLMWASFFASAGVILRRVDADVVHARGPAAMVPNHVDLATVNFCHAAYHEAAAGPPPGAPRLTWRAARRFTLGLERFAFGGRRTRLIDVETEGAKEAMQRHYPGARVTVTPLVYDTARFSPDPQARSEMRSQLGATDDDVVALFMGLDWDAKGLDLALAGLAEAVRRGHSNLMLWVAGRNWAAELDRRARRAGVADRVRLVGFTWDPDRAYAGADLLVLPTLYEQGSRASHEAAASGLPLVVTRVHGATALIGDDEGGIAIERDAGSIGRALALLAADRDLRERMGARARERCLEITGGASIDRWLDLYDQLAG